MRQSNPYDEWYADDAYYWGLKPSSLCTQLLHRAAPTASHPLALIDLGCGEGRNAVHLARCGFEVTGLDTSTVGLAKTRQLAIEHQVTVTTLSANILTWRPGRSYDVFFSTGTLHYLPEEARATVFDSYKAATTPAGLHVVSAFVHKPFIDKAPDDEPWAHSFRSGELLGYYWDWIIEWSVEKIFDCQSSGVPHQHAVSRMVARKP